MAITLDDVKKVAALAKLEFDEVELQAMQQDLEKIVSYVEKLKELDVDDVPETSHVLNLHNVMREDRARTWLSNEEALANAPEKKQGFFSVPKVIG
ncbi:MAG: Asp-tRNA(Asn)/Glu-tRNA(Gln) amidotransferase subunit GatC [candidate division KSB1 bacterium]|nr:Asp-tRNA(Asn)/Glu-tRNA(Gln) amidotransferase subunit GatC [candidate division KSB1 bacterium]MDQ7064089.1 Asp-tRNA(Asn)/Glu-tRNA(Gln) amidotransferase subunit GatC [candidate division KSB1 bacterium]